MNKTHPLPYKILWTNMGKVGQITEANNLKYIGQLLYKMLKERARKHALATILRLRRWSLRVSVSVPFMKPLAL